MAFPVLMDFEGTRAVRRHLQTGQQRDIAGVEFSRPSIDLQCDRRLILSAGVVYLLRGRW
jgi:hypothetical protein